MDYDTYRDGLQHLSGSETYFAATEYATRRAQLERAMAEHQLDAVLISDPADIHYYCGYKTFEVSVHTVLVFLPGYCLLQVPSIETGPAVVTAQADAVVGYRWESPHTVIDPLVDTLKDCHAIGLDLWAPGLRPGLVDALRQHLGASRLHPIGDLIDALRLIKSPAELECLRRSAVIGRIGIDAAVAMIKPGVTENDVAAAGAQALLAAGSEFMSLQPIVTSGPRTSVIHLNHQQRVIQADEPVFLEFGAAWQRYTAPIMQTVVTGHPTDRMLHVRDVCAALQATLLAHMRPGNTFGQAAQAATNVLAQDAGTLFFSGVFGYSVGAQFPPSWVEGTGFIALGQTRTFAPGMVFHLPLCLRAPGEWGIGLSNTVVIEEHTTTALTDNGFALPVCHA